MIGLDRGKKEWVSEEIEVWYVMWIKYLVKVVR